MSYCLETKIQIVILMAKFESPKMVIRELRWHKAVEIPERHTITSIYQTFLETGSVEDCIRSWRPSTITDDIINEVKQRTRNQCKKEMNISKDKVHLLMRDIIRFKPYMMYCTQRLYDEFTC